jgi:hypothetical protein
MTDIIGRAAMGRTRQEQDDFMRQTVLGILLAATFGTPAFAQAPPNAFRADRALEGLTFTTATPTPARATLAAQAPAADPVVSLSFGADVPSVYFFRGIRQEGDPEGTFQPYLDVGVAASDMVSFNIGTWNSFHSGSADGFYESDFYATLNVSVLSVTYTAYTSPNDSFGTVHELAFSAGYDDSTSAFPIAPSATLAFELGDNDADGGGNKGIYLQLGIEPGIPIADSPVSLSIPVTFGLSLKDYYHHSVTGDDGKFGFFSIGLMASAPVGDIFEVHGGVQVLAFPDNILREFNDGESSQVIGTVGFGFSF